MAEQSEKTADPRQRRERALALQYKDIQELPTVVASGMGEIARQIIAIAEQNKIPVKRDKVLAEILPSIGDVSPESFRLVAALISFLYQADGEWKEKHKFLDPVMGDKPASPK